MGPSGIYHWDVRMAQHKQICGIHHMNKIKDKNHMGGGWEEGRKKKRKRKNSENFARLSQICGPLACGQEGNSVPKAVIPKSSLQSGWILFLLGCGSQPVEAVFPFPNWHNYPH